MNILVGVMIGVLLSISFIKLRSLYVSRKKQKDLRIEHKIRSVCVEYVTDTFRSNFKKIDRLAEALGYYESTVKKDPVHGNVYCDPYYRKFEKEKK